MVSILIDVGVTAIDPDPNQPRTFFDESSIRDLGDSIASGGLIQPIRVREHPENPFRFQIVTGERRWRAAKLAGMQKIQCIKVDEEADTEELQLIENIHREDFTPLEEARAYRRLIDKYKLTQAALAKKIHRPRVTVTEMLAINSLPAHMLKELDSCKVNIPKSQLILIAKESNPTIQEQLWQKALTGKLTVGVARAMTKGQRPAISPADRAIRSLEDAVKKLDGLDEISDEQLEPLTALIYKLGKIVAQRQTASA